MGFRLDRFATLYFVSPCLQLLSSREFSIPILMFHSIADEENSSVHPYYCTTTSQAALASQMKHLHAEGYTTCTLAQAIGDLRGGKPNLSRFVVITFDDGYRDFYQHAFPVLSQYGFCATMFLPTAFISEIRTSFKGKECLTWAEVRELSRNGVEFGSHTVTHPQLSDLHTAAINDEIVNSKNIIEQKLGCAVESFAYPFAFPQTDVEFRKSLSGLLRAAGYRNGVCTTVGRANRKSDPLFLERLPVNRWDDSRLFQAKLEGAYDWIARPQHVTKVAKRLALSRFRGFKTEQIARV